MTAHSSRSSKGGDGLSGAVASMFSTPPTRQGLWSLFTLPLFVVSLVLVFVAGLPLANSAEDTSLETAMLVVLTGLILLSACVSWAGMVLAVLAVKNGDRSLLLLIPFLLGLFILVFLAGELFAPGPSQAATAI